MRRFLFALLLCLIAAQAWATVAVVSHNTVACNTTGASPLTASCTTTSSVTVSGSNTAIGVLASWTSTSGNPTMTGSWNGSQSLTAVGASAYSTGQSGGTGVLCLANPAAGNNTLAITATGAAVDELHVVVIAASGVDQTTPCQNFQGIADQTTSITPTVTVTSAVGDIPFSIFAQNSQGVNSCATTQLITDSSTGPNFAYGSSYGVGAATTALSCALTGTASNQISAADFKAAAGGVAADPQSLPMMGFGN